MRTFARAHTKDEPMMPSLTNAYALPLLLVLHGCGGTAEPPPATPAPPASSASPAPGAGTGSTASGDDNLSLDDATAFCVRLHENVVSCAGEFIDLMMDLRGHYDPGFQAKFSTPEAKAAAKKEGIEEVKADGSGPLEPRQQRCREYAQQPPTPRKAPAELEPCFKIADCTQKIECMRPVMEARFRARAEAAAAAQPGPPK
nr:hypothetical protein Hi04_10k_c5591_00009 [uncultured bacterium]